MERRSCLAQQNVWFLVISYVEEGSENQAVQKSFTIMSKLLTVTSHSMSAYLFPSASLHCNLSQWHMHIRQESIHAALHPLQCPKLHMNVRQFGLQSAHMPSWLLSHCNGSQEYMVLYGPAVRSAWGDLLDLYVSTCSPGSAISNTEHRFSSGFMVRNAGNYDVCGGVVIWSVRSGT